MCLVPLTYCALPCPALRRRAGACARRARLCYRAFDDEGLFPSFFLIFLLFLWGCLLRAGHVFTIEPMINEGQAQVCGSLSLVIFYLYLVIFYL